MTKKICYPNLSYTPIYLNVRGERHLARHLAFNKTQEFVSKRQAFLSDLSVEANQEFNRSREQKKGHHFGAMSSKDVYTLFSDTSIYSSGLSSPLNWEFSP